MPALDPDRLGQWFRDLAPALLLYVRQWIDAPAAEDAVQDVFVKLAGQATAPRDVRAWVFRAARNEAVTRRRSLMRRRRRELAVAHRDDAWFEPDAGDLIDARAARTALLSLDIDQRELLVLRLWGGLTFEQTAWITGRPLTTVFRHYRAALDEMRQKLETSCQAKNR